MSKGILQRPLLYLSYYLKAHRQEYYDVLMNIRTNGDWEGWLKFFLRGVYEVSQTATNTAQNILKLQQNHRQLISQQSGGSNNSLLLLDLLFTQPIVNINLVQTHLNSSYNTAKKTVDHFIQLGLLKEITGYQRNRRYRYDPYLALF